MNRKFLTSSLLFFIPVILGYLSIEGICLQLPSSYKANEEYIDREHRNFEVLTLGSSQVQSAVNPEWLDISTLNLASGNQHHDTDFKLLKGIKDRLPKLKTIVIEVSYSHFELPHNGPDFWKNSLYLKYYNINNFERNTYFKDKLVYLSFPKFFSEKIVSNYKGEQVSEFNEFGFDTAHYFGQFQTLGHDEQKIANMKRFKINETPNRQIFNKNTALFEEILNYTKDNELKVILVQTPMYKTYHDRKNPVILKRRDSVVSEALRKYSHVELLNLEVDTVNYNVNDYWNQSHLNPTGAKKFTKSLNEILNRTKASY